MKHFLILCLAGSMHKTVFKMINRTLNSGIDLVSGIPFKSITECTEMGTVIALL